MLLAWDDKCLVCVSVATACPAGRYGADCARAALCGDGAQNDPVTGRCECIPGRRGEDCGHGEFSALLMHLYEIYLFIWRRLHSSEMKPFLLFVLSNQCTFTGAAIICT